VPSLREVEAPDVSDALEQLELVETPPVPRPEPDPPRLERPLAEPARPSLARVLPQEPEPVPAPVEPEPTEPTEAEADDHRDASAAEPAVQRVAAVLIDAVEPSYPRLARRMGWEGSVVCRLAIDSDGAVSTVAVDRSSGRDVLDEAAVSALRRWRFRPATADGDRVPSELRHTVTFRLAVR
jgi:protein TonB